MILDLTGSMSLAYRHLNYDLKLDESPPSPPLGSILPAIGRASRVAWQEHDFPYLLVGHPQVPYARIYLVS